MLAGSCFVLPQKRVKAMDQNAGKFFLASGREIRGSKTSPSGRPEDSRANGWRAQVYAGLALRCRRLTISDELQGDVRDAFAREHNFLRIRQRRQLAERVEAAVRSGGRLREPGDAAIEEQQDFDMGAE